MTETRNPWWSPWRESEGAIVLHVDLTPDADREAEAVSLLDRAETERWRGFLSQRARREFALCRAALRVSLSERLGCADRELSFDRLEHGKPVARVAGRPVDAGFNVSHSGRHGLIAIGGHGCLGVDVEERVPRRDLAGIGSLVYGPAERRLLGNAAGRERVHLFYRLWSMKEALIKALGTGFAEPDRLPDPRADAAGSPVRRVSIPPSAVADLAPAGSGRAALRRRACLQAAVPFRAEIDAARPVSAPHEPGLGGPPCGPRSAPSIAKYWEWGLPESKRILKVSRFQRRDARM